METESLNSHEKRFPTQNTGLAAALGSLFIMPSKVQPFSAIRKADGGRTIFTYYFNTEGSESFCGETHIADKIAVFWANRDRFEAENPNHPLIPIRKGLDSRDWLNRVAHGQINPGYSDMRPKCRTSDIVRASCIRGSGVPLIRFDKESEEFLFPAVSREFMDAYDGYGFRNEHPISLMRRGIEVRKIFIEEIKKCPRAIHYTSGDPASGEFVDCFIPEGMKQEDIDIMLEKFHSL